jgi:hypothetical protein
VDYFSHIIFVIEFQVAKMSGIGAQLYTSLDNNTPSIGSMLQAYK